MNAIERNASRIRHVGWLESRSTLWGLVRPLYRRGLDMLYPRGLPRLMNGTDLIHLPTQLHTLPPTYEPDVWASIMRSVRPGDTVVDAGANYGLYSAALAARVGPSGRVIAVEPDPDNYTVLDQVALLNSQVSRVHTLRAALGSHCGTIYLDAGHGMESRVSTTHAGAGALTPVLTLDALLATEAVDVLKVDVEGYELKVLEGATATLSNPLTAPRLIFLEAHPHAWPPFKTTGHALVSLLTAHGYTVGDIHGNPITDITSYGEVVCAAPPHAARP